MLLMAGCSSAGSAGVGEFFSNPEKMKSVYNQLAPWRPAKPFPRIGKLVQVNVRDALPVETAAIALRPGACGALTALVWGMAPQFSVN